MREAVAARMSEKWERKQDINDRLEFSNVMTTSK
jgi:hypothetical protein